MQTVPQRPGQGSWVGSRHIIKALLGAVLDIWKSGKFQS